MPCAKHHAIKRFWSQRQGNAIVELAVLMPLLSFLSIGAAAVGINLDRALQMQHVARSAAEMFSRHKDFSSDSLKLLLLKAAGGMPMTLTGGEGVIYLSEVKVAQVGVNQGLPVVCHRFSIGNPAIAPSRIGMPVVDSDGHVADHDNSSAARATLPDGLSLVGSECIYVVEFAHDPAELAFRGIFEIPHLYVDTYF